MLDRITGRNDDNVALTRFSASTGTNGYLSAVSGIGQVSYLAISLFGVCVTESNANVPESHAITFN
jgi:hypothetical protein